MFRKMRRSKQEISSEECKKILKEGKRAVLSLIGDEGYPYGVPVNYHYDEEENTIYIHGAKEGHKIDAIRSCEKVSFTTWQQNELSDDSWSWYVTSVIAMGKAEIIEDMDVIIEKVRALGYKYYPDKEEVEEEIRSSAAHVGLIAVHIEHMTGKRIHEK